ncbi:MAG: hypothetical protein E6G78_15975 [Alphaproteobacteria bacterium]|nr:MAG: hypothetical protein E6G78_15975 [Alphaproteobacteria bacterium]
MLAGALDAEHGVTALVRGQPREILERRSAAVIERRFVLPHIAHAPLEPVNATASYKHGSVEVWGSIQSVTACQQAVAQAVGCAPDDVKVNVTFLGGSFGRKIVPDYVLQAVQASKAVGRPVKLIRSREEDMQRARLSARRARPCRGAVAVRGGAQELARPDPGRRLGRKHGRRHLQSELSAAALSRGDRGHAAADPGLFHALGRLDRGSVLLGELCHRARPARAHRSVRLSAPFAVGGSIGGARPRCRRAGVRLGNDAECFSRNCLQLLHRSRRPLQNLCRGGGRAIARGDSLCRQACVLRRRYRPRGQPEHAQSADRGRDRIRADQYAQEQDYLLERRSGAEQLFRLSVVAHRRNAGDRPDRAPERSPAAGFWGSGSGAGCSRAGAGLVSRDRSAARRDAIPAGCFPRQGLTG